MKYIMTLFIMLMFFGCSDSSSGEIQTSQDTQNLQPNVENSDLQPPKPPVL